MSIVHNSCVFVVRTCINYIQLCQLFRMTKLCQKRKEGDWAAPLRIVYSYNSDCLTVAWWDKCPWFELPTPLEFTTSNPDLPNHAVFDSSWGPPATEAARCPCKSDGSGCCPTGASSANAAGVRQKTFGHAGAGDSFWAKKHLKTSFPKKGPFGLCFLTGVASHLWIVGIWMELWEVHWCQLTSQFQALPICLIGQAGTQSWQTTALSRCAEDSRPEADSEVQQVLFFCSNTSSLACSNFNTFHIWHIYIYMHTHTHIYIYTTYCAKEVCCQALSPPMAWGFNAAQSQPVTESPSLHILVPNNISTIYLFFQFET